LPEPKPSHRQVLKALTDLWEQGQVERDPAEDRKGATYRWRLHDAPQPDLEPLYSDRSRSGYEGSANLTWNEGSPFQVSGASPEQNLTWNEPPLYVPGQVGSARCRCGGVLEPSERDGWLRCDRCRNYVRASDPALVRKGGM
ncbi:hypothetical protein NET02_16125, partial [Thermomicrobiaceae bacterium CFH 74404]